MNQSEMGALSRYMDALEGIVFEVRDRVKALEGKPGGAARSTKTKDPEREAMRKYIDTVVKGEVARVGRDALADAFDGPWQEGRSYERGSLVQRNGSCWIAIEATSGKPGDPDSGWTVFAKAGRDGRR
jgi:hypothetical protein